MTDEQNSEKNIAKSAKAVKRVRFSNEIKRLDFSTSDESESLPYTNETNVLITSTEFINDLVDDSFNHGQQNINPIEISFDPELDTNNNNQLLSYPENVTVIFPHEVENPAADESLSNETLNSFEDSPTGSLTDHEDESPDLIDLINETQLMTISSATHAKLIDTNAEEQDPVKAWSTNISENVETHSDIKEHSSDLTPSSLHEVKSKSRKRSLEGTFVEKQTVKINACLRQNEIEICSADEIKNAVFDAWKEVKKENSLHHDNAYSKSMDPKVKKPNKNYDHSVSLSAFEKWKKCKFKSKRRIKKSEHCSQKLNKSSKDLEESKMAFRAWKMKKDEMLKYQQVERLKKQEKEKSDFLVKEKIKKNDAQTAYKAWNAHKLFTQKSEKARRQWLLEKEKEKLHLKKKRSDEAEKRYYDWLRKKVLERFNTYQIQEDKPPWTPPGKIQ